MFFGYRESIFKRENSSQLKHIILGAYFKLKPLKSTHKSKKKVKEILRYRFTRHPMNFPTLGSTFKNVPLEKIPPKVKKMFLDKIKKDPKPILPAAVLLSAAGLEGFSYGGAQFSKKHCNFIINYKKAKASDVKKLIEIAQKKVFEKFNINLEPEIEILK
jgi:UDP-N-acetylmuramate dehydrogenase